LVVVDVDERLGLPGADERDEIVDVGVGQRSGFGLSPRRHHGAGTAVADRRREQLVVGDAQKLRIADRGRVVGEVALTAIAVANLAVLLVVRRASLLGRLATVVLVRRRCTGGHAQPRRQPARAHEPKHQASSAAINAS
jgi:hypothetical protein